MNYTKVYEAIINGSRHRKLSTHTETHHILPKSLGGKNDRDNLVELTPREHFICHKLLMKMHPKSDRLMFAFWAMCNQKKHPNQKRNYVVTSRVYEYIKSLVAKRMMGNTYHLGGSHTEDTRKLMSEQATGVHHYGFKGYYITPVGKVDSSSVAGEDIGVSSSVVAKWCKNADTLVLSATRYYQNSGVFDEEDIGKTMAELGFGFEKAERVIPKSKTTKPSEPSAKRYRYTTPHGVFMSGKELPSSKMMSWCKDNGRKLSKLAVLRLPDLVNRVDVGKTFKELGYSREEI